MVIERTSTLGGAIGFACALGAFGCVDASGAGQSPIVGGRDADVKQLPWQISLQDEASGHFCGGSIVGDRWVLTAQHCTESGSAENFRVVAGISKLSQSATGQTRKVKKVFAAPGYTDPSAGDDVALLELDQPLDLTGDTARAIAIVSAEQAAGGATDPETMATVSGWGVTDPDEFDLPDQLQVVDVPIVSNADADAAYKDVDITEDQLAAGYMGVGGKDSCQGDSGGPLVVAAAGDDKLLAGVVSWGEGCAKPDHPGMYARVSSFEKFIRDHTEGTSSTEGLLINEILADPPAGYDANGDGVASTTTDEFIEIVNTGTDPVDLSGATVADQQAVRATFPDGTTLEPDAALVLFGGGMSSPIEGVTVLALAPLQLNNGGDSVTITSEAGEVLAAAEYGASGGDNQSLVRSPELAADSPLVAHTSISSDVASPGERADGSPL